MTAVALTAYEKLTGGWEAFQEAAQQLRDQIEQPPVAGDGPVGEYFDFDDLAEMRVRLPRLAALFLDADE